MRAAAILLAQKAAFEDLRSKGAIITGPEVRFAGHSLGEYGAIACMVEGRGLAVSALADVSVSFLCILVVSVVTSVLVVGVFARLDDASCSAPR